ncbi:unnamed protein product [Rotaria magnacalcarata]
MSSTPITPENSSSSRVQSSNQVTAVKTSRPPSAVETSRPSLAVKTSRPPSAVETSRPRSAVETSRPSLAVKTSRPPSAVETSRPPSAVKTSRPSSAVETSRPPSASLKLAENDTTTVTPEVATNDNGASSGVPVDGKEETYSSKRSPSVEAATSESCLSSGVHPQSAANIDLTANPVAHSTTADKKSSRLPSANSKVDESNTHDYTINVTRSRSPSVIQTTVRTKSRLSSASVKQDETTVDDSTTEQQNTPTLSNANDADATLPIIEHPPSVTKLTPTDEFTITVNVDSTDSPVILTENAPSSDEIQPIEVTPRISSASQIP